MSKKFSKKIEREMLDAIAMVSEPTKCALITDGPVMQGMRPSKVWIDEVPDYEHELLQEPSQNPFSVIANWLRGNPAPAEPPSFLDKLNLGGMVLPPEFFKFERDEDELIVPLDTEREESMQNHPSTWERTGSEKGRDFVSDTQARAWLVNPRTGEQTEIPIQSFDMDFTPNFENTIQWPGLGSLFPRVLMDEVDRQSEAVEKMDSILRDAPVEKPLLRTHFSRRIIDGQNRIVLNPVIRDEEGRFIAKSPLAFALDDAHTLSDNLIAEIEAAEDDYS